MHVVFKTFTRLVIISSLLGVWSIVFMYPIMLDFKIIIHTSLNVTYPSKPVITLGYNHTNESICALASENRPYR